MNKLWQRFKAVDEEPLHRPLDTTVRVDDEDSNLVIKDQHGEVKESEEEPLIQLSEPEDTAQGLPENNVPKLDAVLPYLFFSRKIKKHKPGVLEVDPTVMQVDLNTSLFKVCPYSAINRFYEQYN